MKLYLILNNVIVKKFIQIPGLAILLVFGHINVHSQKIGADDSLTFKKRIYKTSITGMDGKKSAGYLANLSDSILYLSDFPLHVGTVKIDDHLFGYPYNHLEKIEIKRKGAVGRAAWKGALIGLAAGVITGLVSGDDPVAPVYNNPNDPFGNAIGNGLNVLYNSFRMTAGEKAVAGGVVGAGTGALIGALVGSLAKKKFIIGGNRQKFHSMSKSILEKLYVNPVNNF